MSTSASNRNSKAAGKTSDPPTRRGRLPGPETGFGHRLRVARGIETQADVAERAEIARSAYARYETGDRFPSVPELRRLCEALAVSPEHLIFGETGSDFTPSPSPIAAMAPEGDSEKARIARHVLTGVLLNALPKTEAEALRELIWASASRQLKDQPEALEAITQICRVMAESMWPEMDSLIDEKLETDPAFKEIVESLSDDASDDS